MTSKKTAIERRLDVLEEKENESSNVDDGEDTDEIGAWTADKYRDLLGYEPLRSEDGYLLTSEGEKIPRDADVCAIFPFCIPTSSANASATKLKPNRTQPHAMSMPRKRDVERRLDELETDSDADAPLGRIRPRNSARHGRRRLVPRGRPR